MNRGDVTLKDMEALWSDLAELVTIGKCLPRLREFRDKHGLTGKEVLDINKLNPAYQ